MRRKKQPFTQLHQSSLLSKPSVGNSTFYAESSVGNNQTGIKDYSISSTVSVKKLSRSEIAHMKNIQKFNDTTPTDIKSTNDVGSAGSSAIGQCRAVSVVRVKRSAKINPTSKQIDRVRVTKLPRSKSSDNRQLQPMSIDDVDTMDMGPDAIEMQSISNNIKTLPQVNAGQTITNTTTTVRRLPRKIVSTQSNYT